MKPTHIEWQQQIQDEINRRVKNPKETDKEKFEKEMEAELKRIKK